MDLTNKDGVAWLGHLSIITLPTGGTGLTESPLSDWSNDIHVAAGKILRGKLFACAKDFRLNEYTAALGFNVDESLVNTDWTTEDRIVITDGHEGNNIEISTWFQPIPDEHEPNGTYDKQFVLEPKFKWSSTGNAHFNSLDLTVHIDAGPGVMPPHQPSDMGEGTFKCKKPSQNPTATTTSYKVSTSHNTDADLNGDGRPDDVPNNYVLPDTTLRGSLRVCASQETIRGAQRAGVKFTAKTQGTLVTAPWADEPYPSAGLPALQFVSGTMHWYQEAPKEDGLYLIVPRVFSGDCSGADAQSLDGCVLAEGSPFKFCVTHTSDLVGTLCDHSANLSEPMGAGTFNGSDTLSPGLGPLQCSEESHNWQGTMDGLIAPDTETDPTGAFSGNFQLDAYVECEDLNAGTGHVLGLTVASTGLQFQFLSSLEFARAGPAVTAEVFGVCTSGADPYLCELTFTGVWTPRFSPGPVDKVGLADISNGVLAVNYDSPLETWEEW